MAKISHQQVPMFLEILENENKFKNEVIKKMEITKIMLLN